MSLGARFEGTKRRLLTLCSLLSRFCSTRDLSASGSSCVCLSPCCLFYHKSRTLEPEAKINVFSPRGPGVFVATEQQPSQIQ